jgi:hypothetical protein
MGIAKHTEMTFSKLPFPPLPEKYWTEVGNGAKVATYEFRIDKLTKGVSDSNSDELVFDNITVRLIDSPKSEFVVGMNVLRYIKVAFRPTSIQSICQLTLDENGKSLMEKHRVSKGVNNLQSTFNYLLPDAVPLQSSQ